MTPPLRGLHLHVDCASGAAGDMMLGALIDLGVPFEVIGAALDAIGAGRERLRGTRVVKHGIAAVDIKVDTGGELAGVGRHEHAAHGHARPKLHIHASTLAQVHDHSHHGSTQVHVHAHAHGDHLHIHAHEHHASAADHEHVQGPPRDHAHYHYADIRTRIDGAELPAGAKHRALDIFDRIARAEAKLHGTTLDDVTFHEVGAIDSVVDVVGTAAALDWLAPASVSCSAVAMGHGTITCAHGVLPVPSPAALEILRDAGGVVTDGGVDRELCTPTGAAILAHAVTSWTAAPTGRPVAVGWGAGDAELADRANALRVTALALSTGHAESVWQIEANLDDMSPELCGPAAEAIFAAGAVDVWWSAITMKKGRPALTLFAIASRSAREPVIAAILRETTTIGVRYALMERTVLERKTVEVTTRYGTIAIKVAVDGDTVMNAAPEYESCAAAAKQHGIPIKLVYAAALAAFEGVR